MLVFVHISWKKASCYDFDNWFIYFYLFVKIYTLTRKLVLYISSVKMVFHTCSSMPFTRIWRIYVAKAWLLTNILTYYKQKHPHPPPHPTPNTAPPHMKVPLCGTRVSWKPQRLKKLAEKSWLDIVPPGVKGSPCWSYAKRYNINHLKLLSQVTSPVS